VRIERDELFAETRVAYAKVQVALAAQILEMQSYRFGVVQIGRKVVSRTRPLSAHAKNRAADGGKLVDMIMIPRVIEKYRAPTSKYALLIADELHR